jgi:hypothetical protein
MAIRPAIAMNFNRIKNTVKAIKIAFRMNNPSKTARNIITNFNILINSFFSTIYCDIDKHMSLTQSDHCTI